MISKKQQSKIKQFTRKIKHRNIKRTNQCLKIKCIRLNTIELEDMEIGKQIGKQSLAQYDRYVRTDMLENRDAKKYRLHYKVSNT